MQTAGSVPGSGRSPARGYDNPLQYSCLENPTVRGAWQATVHGVALSLTWLKQLTHTQEWRNGWVQAKNCWFNPTPSPKCRWCILNKGRKHVIIMWLSSEGWNKSDYQKCINAFQHTLSFPVKPDQLLKRLPYSVLGNTSLQAQFIHRF